MKNIFCVFLLLTMIISCGKKIQTTQTKISFASGSSSMLGSGIQMNGGIVVTGHRLDDSESFNIVLKNASDEQVLDLIKGQWEFAAVGWEGSANGFFSGPNRCAYTGILDLNTTEAAITLNLNTATCAGIPGYGAILSHPDYMWTNPVGMINQFKPITLQSCSTLTFTAGVPACTGIGLTGSFKIVVMGGKKKLGGVMSPLPGMETACTPIITAGTASTPLSLPVGNMINGKKENLIETMVLAFQSADCTGSPISYRFYDSMYVGIHQTNLVAQAHSAVGTNLTTLYLEHNSTTVSSQFGSNPFGYGKNGDLNITTTPISLLSTSDYAKIITIDPVNKKILVIGNPSIGVDDEIMWYVNSENVTNACAGFVPGMFGFAHVKGVLAGTDTELTLDQSLTSYMLDTNPPTPTTLVAPTTIDLVNTYCSMQIVRVPQFRNISTIVSSPVLNTPPFNGVTGGLLPFKVNNAINISSPLIIQATGSGASVPTTSGCGATGKRCLKMGGGSATGLGGGIILAWIKQINFSGTGSLEFSSNGIAGGGLAGGDGGFISTAVNNIAYSGTGAAPGISQLAVGASGTGNGASGVLYFKYCANPNGVNLSSAGNTSQGCGF